MNDYERLCTIMNGPLVSIMDENERERMKLNDYEGWKWMWMFLKNGYEWPKL